MPSEVLQRATTFDLAVLDLSLSHERYKNRKSRGEVPDIREKDLVAAIQHIRSSNNG